MRITIFLEQAKLKLEKGLIENLQVEPVHVLSSMFKLINDELKINWIMIYYINRVLCTVFDSQRSRMRLNRRNVHYINYK